jgi:hypothetical protein
MGLPRDLPEGWEKKALIVVVVIVLIIAVYAFNPFQPKANVTNDNLSSPAAPTIVPLPQYNSGNSSNTSSNSSNGTPSQITSDQAKNIAEQSNSGYVASQPSQGTLVVNSTTVAVWIVPITKTGSSKTVYIDLTSGRIVKET